MHWVEPEKSEIYLKCCENILRETKLLEYFTMLQYSTVHIIKQL